MKVKTYEVIEAKEVLCGEFIEDYYAIYEETLIKNFEMKFNYLNTKDCFIEKNITIYKASPYASIQRIKTYPIEKLNIEDVHNRILIDFPGLLNNAPVTSRAV